VWLIWLLLKMSPSMFSSNEWVRPVLLFIDVCLDGAVSKTCALRNYARFSFVHGIGSKLTKKIKRGSFFISTSRDIRGTGHRVVTTIRKCCIGRERLWAGQNLPNRLLCTSTDTHNDLSDKNRTCLTYTRKKILAVAANALTAMSNAVNFTSCC